MKSTTRKFTTRVALVAALAAASIGCSEDSKTSDSTAGTGNNETVAPGQSTVPGVTFAPVDPGTVYPLTGLPITDEDAAARPALAVKIDNDPGARPQTGLNAADIVFEQIIEVQTRFTAVFQSQGSDPVGPIRSARDADINLLGSFNQPLYVYSGANPGVTDLIAASDFVDLSAVDESVFTDGGFFRDDTRAEPFNLYAPTSQLWNLAPDGAGPPPPQFQYRPVGETLVGQPSNGVDVYLEGLFVGWRYDAASGHYLRAHDGAPHVDASGEQISTRNVIVMVVEYPPSRIDARSPLADTIGFGEVWVLSDGMLVRGVWTRSDRLSPIQLIGPDGPIALTPGRTWVELARLGTFSEGF